MRPADRRSLEELASLFGVETAYRDVEDERREADPESLTAVLALLGAEVDPRRPGAGLDDAIRARRAEMAAQTLPPAAAVWLDDPSPRIPLTLPAPNSGAIGVTVDLEDGGSLRFDLKTADLHREREGRPDGDGDHDAGHGHARYTLPLPGLADHAPPGYHTLRVEAGATAAECLLILAPRRAWSPAAEGSLAEGGADGRARPGDDAARRAGRGGRAGRRWSMFCPLYALRTDRDWGAGDLTGLRELSEWVAELGGDGVGTLPLLASFLDEPFAPSPYTPVSRLFWNEFYLDVADIPGIEDCTAARDRLASAATGEALAALRARDFVDYRSVMRLKRSVLEPWVDCLFRGGADGSETALPGDRAGNPGADLGGGLAAYLARRPRAHDYARFRATAEARGTDWHEWPSQLRDGHLEPGDYDQGAYRYHLAVQWLTEEALARAGRIWQDDGEARGLYLDLPLGVHPGGYDTWRERDSFAFGAAGGAPPDTFFSRGQNWGFPPMHPEGIRRDRYAYLRESLAVQMAHAAYLRVDHVMGLHRLFWVPDGMPATRGVYVRYPAEELYAVLSLESHRHRTVLVGEDLGTVPDYVRPAMRRHGLHRMHVLAYELGGERLAVPPPGSLAALNTHDMPPFAGFFLSTDVEERVRAGQLEEDETRRERSERARLLGRLERHLRTEGHLRTADERTTAPAAAEGAAPEVPGDAGGDATTAPGQERLSAALRASLRHLAASKAELTLVNLEDLVLQTVPQNVPGTSEERPNWRLRMPLSLRELREIQEVRETLDEVDTLRDREGST